jgi:hypothetical protein
MSRLEQSLSWGILPFLNRPDFNALRNTSNRIRQVSDKNQWQVLFYGLALPIYGNTIITYTMVYPKPKKSDIFCHLLYKNYRELEKSLKKNEDVFYEYMYTHKNAEGIWVDSMRGAIIYNYCWNSMTLMQVAYMLKDGIAIDLLKKYNRKTAFKIRDYSSEHNMDIIKIIKNFNEHEIIPCIYKMCVEYNNMIKNQK